MQKQREKDKWQKLFKKRKTQVWKMTDTLKVNMTSGSMEFQSKTISIQEQISAAPDSVLVILYCLDCQRHERETI